MITLKSDREIAIMREAGHWAARLLDELGQLIRPGTVIASLNDYAENFFKRHGLGEVFKNYCPSFADRPFPGHICVSVNDEVVHGIPTRTQRLHEGDIVAIDVGVRYRGFVGDTARTYPVGSVSPEARRLIKVTREALRRAIRVAREGARIGDIGHAIESYVEQEEGLKVIRQYIGHGVGRQMHEDPAVPNFGKPGKGLTLKAGLVIAIEPMVVLGSPATYVKDDGWTVCTKDGKWAAHFEHTIAIMHDKTIILTETL